jgi:4-amino-4-deoxy-L-arabinose transferase-like glycosyltransferase
VSSAASDARPLAPEDHRQFVWALAMVALLPRLFVAIAWSREPVWDGHYYHFGAERIAQGLGYSEDVWANGRLLWKPWVHYPVGYSGVLGALYAVFGSKLWVAPLFNVALGVLTAVLCYELARRGLSETRARIAGALCALHPGLIAQSALVMTELLAACLLVALGLLAARGAGKRDFAGFGLALGAAALVRPASLLLFPLGFVAKRLRARAMALGAGLIVAACALVVLPWTLRNCARLDGCALVSTNGGWNLAIGAISETGRFTSLRASDGCPVASGQVQQDRCWARVGVERIVAAPGRWLSLAPKKLAETFNHESFAIEYLHEADPRSWPEARRVAGRELLSGAHRCLLWAAALSVVALPWRRGRKLAGLQALLGAFVVGFGVYAFASDEHPFFWFCLFVPLVAVLPLPGRPTFGPCLRYAIGALLITALTHVIFFGEDRYHLALSPLLCVLAAAALRPKASDSPALGADA